LRNALNTSRRRKGDDELFTKLVEEIMRRLEPSLGKTNAVREIRRKYGFWELTTAPFTPINKQSSAAGVVFRAVSGSMEQRK